MVMKYKRLVLLAISTWICQSQAFGQTVSILGISSPSAGGSVSYPGYYGLNANTYPPTTITNSDGYSYGLWFSTFSSVTVGQTVYLFATPASGYSFSQWTGGATGTQNPLIISAATDLNVTATFIADIALSIPSSPAAGGVVYQPYYASDPGGGTSYAFTDSQGQALTLWYPTSQLVKPGSSVYLFAYPSTGYAFSQWTGDFNSTTNPIAVTAAADLNVTATFKLLDYNATAEIFGSGSVAGTGSYPYGSTATLEATPAIGSSFLGWDVYNSASSKWAATISGGSLDYSSEKNATIYQNTFLRSYFSPNVSPSDSNLTESLKSYLSIYPYDLNFSGVPLSKNSNQLTQAHLEGMSVFVSSEKKISSLNGLEYAKNLQSLIIPQNGIQSITPILSSPNLSYLDLSGGGTITSLDGMSALSALTYVYLEKQRVSSITPLINLPYLYHLKIRNNFLDLSDVNLQTEIYNLRNRGVIVQVERQIPKPIQDLSTSMSAQESTLALSPSDAQANFVYALELMLNLFEDNSSRSLKALAISLGAAERIGSFSLPDIWLEGLDYGKEVNASFDYAKIETYLEQTFLKTLEIADLHLSRINSSTTYVTLTQDLTGLEQITYADIGDVYMLRAMIKGITGLAQIMLSHEWPMTAGKAKALHDAGIVNMESLFDSSVNFGKLKKPNSLLAAKESLQSAVTLYNSASGILRSRMTSARFFNLSAEDLIQEAQFRLDLGHALASFDYQYDMNTSNSSQKDAFHLSKLFGSKVDLASALPPAVGNKFESSQVSDPTFGGLLPYWTSDALEAKMQKEDLLATDSLEGAKAIPGATNWLQSNWLGAFYVPTRTNTQQFWIYHASLGWVYLSSSSPSDIWLYRQSASTWLWTRKSTFPYLYEETGKVWFHISASGELKKWNGGEWVIVAQG